MNTANSTTASAGSGSLLSKMTLVKIGLAVAAFAWTAFASSWQFALLLLATIGFHEQGHVWAMRSCGVKTPGFFFLPSLGGVAVSADQVKMQREQVWIVLMGPVWGFSLAFGIFCGYLVTGAPALAASAGFMAFVNLFNLLPVNPLDGGRLLVAAASTFGGGAARRVVRLSVAVSACLTLLGLIPLVLGVLMVLAGLSESRAMRHANPPEPMSWRGAFRTAGVHLALAFLLFELWMLSFGAPGADYALSAMLGLPPAPPAAASVK